MNILITGASSGIGKACAELLAGQGNQVFALARRFSTGHERRIGNGLLHEVHCDVTSDALCAEAVEYMRSHAKTIDALVCCAGTGIAGAVEDTSVEELEAQLRVNLYAVQRMLALVLPVMRDQRSGKIILIGSVAAVYAIPYQGMYSVSKFALEGLCGALRNEVRPFGIRCCTVLPGDTRTAFTGSRGYTKRTAENEAYRDAFCRAVHSMVKSELNGKEPVTVARAVAKALKRRNPPPRIVVGWEYKLLCSAGRLIPNRLISWALYRMYCKSRCKGSALWSFERDVQGKNND